MSSADNYRISGGQLLCLIITVRLSSLFLTQSLSYLQFFAELSASAILSAIVFILFRYGMLPDGVVFRAVLIAVMILTSFADIFSYFDFTVTTAKPEVPVYVIVGALALFSVYSGLLGTEAVARFSALSLIAVAICILIALQTNISAVRYSFFIHPQNESVKLIDVLRCVDVPVLFALLAPYTEKRQGRAVFAGVCASYAVSIAVIMMCRAVLGKTAAYYSSPVFALFQLGEAGAFNKLDVFYVCSALVLTFTEAALSVSLVYDFIKRRCNHT